jgi:hypothetical protein
VGEILPEPLPFHLRAPPREGIGEHLAEQLQSLAELLTPDALAGDDPEQEGHDGAGLDCDRSGHLLQRR